MEPIQGIILGVIQGLTEFLPVSSSGHLALAQHLFGITEPALLFDVSLHVGTLCAVLIVFRRDIQMMVFSIWHATAAIFGKTEKTESKNQGLKLILLIVVGSIPTGLIGLGLKHVESLFSSLALVGFMFLVTGGVLLATRNCKAEGVGIKEFSWKRAFIVGVAQGLAVLPGISRSGTTIAVGLFLGLDRRAAARFSFLLSIPAIAGAELLLSIGDILSGGASLDTVTLLGSLTAFAVGYVALKLLLKIVQQGGFYLFAPYCFAVGGLTLWLTLV